MEVKTTSTVDGEARSVVVDFDFGADLDAAREINGDAIVFNHFVKGGRLSVQALVRPKIAEGLTEAEIQEYILTCKLPDGTGRRSVSKGAKMEQLAEGMGAEDLDKMIAMLQAKKDAPSEEAAEENNFEDSGLEDEQ